MDKEIILTPEELYYLGRFLQAKYIDYAYIAAMSDIKQNYKLFEQETKASLVSSGVLMEDFGGDLELDQSIRILLNPIFFGETETSIDICTVGEESTVAVHKFHFYDGTITMVTGDHGKLMIKTVDAMAIQELISGILPEQYNGKFEVVDEVNKETVSRLIAVKSVIVGKTAVVKTYIESDHILYRENQEKIESITRDMFITDVYDVVKGV